MLMTSYSSFALVLLCVYNFSFLEALKSGFSVEIIHRDSPKSPFYNPIETQFQRLSNAIQRSINRVNHFNQNFVTKGTVESTVIRNQGEYLMSYSIGTPPFQLFGIVDTGSDIIWLQCQPCKDCYHQSTPIFDPSKSNTYKILPCSSPKCPLRRFTCSSHKKCEYTIMYADESYSKGDLSVDTLTFDSTNGSRVKIPKIMIGCGHQNSGIFPVNGSGIVGLGGGTMSLITQLGSSIDGKFSYCLMPMLSSQSKLLSSKLSFGDAALVSGHRTVSTPLAIKDGVFYNLNLEAFSVGEKRIKFGNSSSKECGGEGNIIIDSGTTLTLLPNDVYSNLESTVAEAIHLKRVDDPNQFLSLCYQTTSKKLNLPKITIHFKGADIKLHPVNTFVRVAKEIVCFAFRSSNVAIFGNLAQQNFLVGYDLSKKTVSFKHKNCAKN